MTTFSVMGLDARYTVAIEGIRDELTYWVARFCGTGPMGVIIGAYPTKERAEQAAREFHDKRWGN